MAIIAIRKMFYRLQDYSLLLPADKNKTLQAIYQRWLYIEIASLENRDFISL
jgi:hypothetical protein